MRRTILVGLTALLAALAVARSAQATEVGYGRKFGLGFVIGDPTGLSGKMWVGSTNAIDAGLGFWGAGVNDGCWVDNNGVRHCDFGASNGTFNIDYLWQSNIVRGSAQLDWHIGAGGRFVWWGNCTGDCVAVAARAPVGVDLMFNNPSFLELFFELGPAFYVVPHFDLRLELGLGVRLYF